MHSAAKGKLLAVIGDEVSTVDVQYVCLTQFNVFFFYINERFEETRPF